MPKISFAKPCAWLGFFLLLWPDSVRAQTPLSDLDALRYIASQPDLIAAFGANAADGRNHYETWGIKEGRRITFEPLNYIASHPDLIAAFGVNETKAVTHYIQWGFKEKRQITFNPLNYIASHADLISAFGADVAKGARHYIESGYVEKRRATFDPARYMASHPDLIQAFAGDEAKAATHYIQWGYKEQRQTTFSDLEALQYIASFTDLIQAFGADVIAGIRHYVTVGYRAGRRIVFDALAYIASSPDLIAAFGTDTLAGVKHYVQWGYLEGRRVTFDPSLYLSLYADLRAVFGADTTGATRHYIQSGFKEGRAVSRAPAILVSTPSINFGQTTINATSVAQVITVRNSGTASLVVTSVSTTDSAQFPVWQTCTAASIAPDATCSISISFKPSSSGIKSATISITHNASGNPSTVSLTGTGASASLSMSDLGLTLNVLGLLESKILGAVSASSPSGASVTYSIQTQGAYGVASINSATGAVTYTISDLLSSATATSDRVIVKATAGSDSVTANVNISLRYDPLLPNQWHLSNRGQDSFASLPPTAGNDINVAGAWAAGLSGRGVRVAVVDSGLEIGHEDLKDNVDVSQSLNLVNGSTDPTARGPSDHGTRVAGIIAASAFNNKGGRGIAYGARLRGYNLLAEGGQSPANKAKSLGGDAVSSDNDVFNQSFGIGASVVNKSLQPFNNFDGEINFNITTLRGGRGALGIQSAGNEFEAQSGDRSTCGYANQFGVTCGHVASDTRRASTYPIVVGAMAADGKKSSYSTTGASIWIAAPGGEYGYSSSYVSSSNPNIFKPAIVTTTSTGCSNYSQAFNALDSLGANPLAAQCQHTAQMNGTSAAAPIVSGVVALMLEANPQLTWRDVKHILASTATVVDVSFRPISYTGLLPSGALTLEQGWVRNAAGYFFHNWYGFGQVDAARAVAMAKGYKAFLPPRNDGLTFTLRATQDIVIPSTSSYNFTANVTSGMSVVEGVVLFMNFDTPGVYCNQVEVTSPSGTKSILLNGGAGFTQQAVREVRLASNAFYGESAVGVWRVTYHNLCNSAQGSTVLPTGSDQTLLFVGF